MPVGCSLALANRTHNSWESRRNIQPQHTAPLPHLQKLQTCPQILVAYHANAVVQCLHAMQHVAGNLQPSRKWRFPMVCLQTWGDCAHHKVKCKTKAEILLMSLQDARTLTKRLVFFSRKPVRAFCNIFGSRSCSSITLFKAAVMAYWRALKYAAEQTFLSAPSCSCM